MGDFLVSGFLARALENFARMSQVIPSLSQHIDDAPLLGVCRSSGSIIARCLLHPELV